MDDSISSYINNLHPPRYRGLYQIISKIITKAIPLWNTTLTGLANEHYNKASPRITYDKIEYDSDAEGWLESHGLQQQPDEAEWEWYDRSHKWIYDNRTIIKPEPRPFTPPRTKKGYKEFRLEDYAKTGLQVIVKLANIELTPEKPEYAGGSWHVEGALVCDDTQTICTALTNENKE